MWWLRPYGIVSLWLAISIMACGEDEIFICDICTLTTELRGVVVTEQGQAVTGATVSLMPLYGVNPVPCGGLIPGLDDPVDLITDIEGSFEGIVDADSLADPKCVEVSVEPPEGSHLMAKTDSIMVDFSVPSARPPTTTVTIILEAG